MNLFITALSCQYCTFKVACFKLSLRKRYAVKHTEHGTQTYGTGTISCVCSEKPFIKKIKIKKSTHDISEIYLYKHRNLIILAMFITRQY